jgi:hypothetical protein
VNAAGRLVEPAKGPDQKQNRDGNAEQPQKKITAHWVTSSIEQFLEVIPLLQKSSHADTSETIPGFPQLWN